MMSPSARVRPFSPVNGSALLRGRVDAACLSPRSLPLRLQGLDVSEKILGRGAYGTVRMASCTSTGRRFALKALEVSAKVSQKKIDAEIKNMERVIGLPCVIQSKGVIKSPDCSFILMPLAHGSLRDEVNKWSSPRLSEVDLRKVARPILVG